MITISGNGTVSPASLWCGSRISTHSSNENCSQPTFGSSTLTLEMSKDETYLLVGDYSNNRIGVIRTSDKEWVETISFTESVTGLCADDQHDNVVYVTTPFVIKRITIPILSNSDSRVSNR
mmetsp:Transcript_3908/g.14766  ORF Transcript_3908/g.14766 Transcript_3908/m.14766 type:complete len:121 (+) Transcript_3908:711-1073(+)